MRIAYVIGRYPALSHAFLMREIEALRRLGVGIETISIRSARESDLRTDADRDARRTTFYVLPAGPLKLARAHLSALARSPRRYLGTLAHALRLGPAGTRGRLWQLFYFAEAMVVWRHCRHLGIAHLHSHFADTGTDSAMLAAHFERPAGSEQGWSWSFTLHGPVEFIEARSNRLAAKLRSARFVVCVSDFAREAALALLDQAGPAAAGGTDDGDRGANLHVIRLGVDTDRFSPAAGALDGESGSGAARDDEPTVLCLGRLIPLKGQALLIEAIAQLVGEGVGVRATIAGEGSSREALEAAAGRLGLGDRVSFLGGVGQDAVVDLYRRATVFCLPSLDEGLPAVLMEAMACGTPVVGTKVAGIGELVTDGEDGVLVAPGDAAALAGALARLLDDPKLRARLGAAGRETVSRRYRLDRQAAELASLFERELGHG